MGTMAGVDDDRTPPSELALPGAGPSGDLGVAEAVAELSRVAAEAAELAAEAAGSPGGALVATSGSLPAAALKGSMVEMRSKVARKQAELVAAQRQLQARLDEQLSAALEVMGPLTKMVERLADGIATVNLYLGRDEEILTLAEGEPAPAETPITVRQMVLSMDQECAVAAESGGIDARSIEEFDAWLAADPAHLDQVLPEARGVVVLVPRRTAREYRDPWVQQRMDEENRRSYWLIRNGGRLYRMVTEFNVGERLIPARDEFTSFFVTTERDWTTHEVRSVPIEPGSSGWLAAEERADARKRHYMKVALILQGLLDRTTVFHPLPAPTVSLLGEQAYDAGHVRLVTDAEAALGTGREPFATWLARLNAELRPGMRIIGAFGGQEFAEHRLERGAYGNERLTPTGASKPASEVLHTISERLPDGGLVFRYARTDEIWVDDGWRSELRLPKTRARCVVYPTDRFILPFDLVSTAEMEAYLTARTDRHQYVTMIPLLKAAVAAKAAEAATEAPFRALLAAQMATANRLSVAEASEAVPALVEWWKLANRWHRPLVAEDAKTQAKAIRMIVAEHAARLGAERQGSAQAAAEAAVVAAIRAARPDAIVVARKRDGTYVALEAQVPGRTVFVRRHLYTTTGRARASTEWVLPAGSWRRWRVLWASPVWEGWDHTATLAAHLTGPELEALVAQLRHLAEAEAGGSVLAVTYEPARRRLEAYLARTEELVIPELALSGRLGDFDLPQMTASWRRSTANAVVLEPGRRVWGRSWPRRDPLAWKAESVVWSDPVAVAAAVAGHARWAAAWDRAAALAQRSRDAMSSLTKAWREAAEEAAYQRFLEDYADPELWEGHRKTLRLVWPQRHGRALEAMLDHLVERGADIDGLSVSEAAALHLEVVGQAVEVAEDVAGLHIHLPHDPDAEPDDEAKSQ